MKWKKSSDIPEDDKTYLVCWLDCEGKYSSPHRAYYRACEGKFFSLENNKSHPIVADIYIEMPELP